MKRRMSIIFGVVLAAMCLLSMTAFAAGNPGVSLPVTVSLSGTLPSPAEEFTVQLKADNASYPMPEGSDGGICSLTVTGAETKSFPTITYDRVGIYTYTVYQLAGSNRKCTYDSAVYALTVYVTNAENGGLEATAVLHLNGEEEKMPAVEFKNVYETVRPTPTPDPDIPDPNPPLDPDPDTPVEPDTPTPPEPTTPDTPKTGDPSAPLLYAGLIAAGLGGFAVLFLTRRTKKAED